MIKMSKLLEGNSKIAKYSNQLGSSIRIFKPRIRGWSFDVEHMTGSWYWENPKFEDIIYATWGWEGKNEIPIETSDGQSFKSIKLKLTPKETSAEQLDVRNDVKKYIDTMKKELPKLERELSK